VASLAPAHLQVASVVVVVTVLGIAGLTTSVETLSW